MEKSDIFLLVDITLVCCDIDIISTATTTLSTTADLNMTISRLPDVVDYGFKMAATKPELERTFKRWEIATRFQRLPPNFRPVSEVRGGEGANCKVPPPLSRLAPPPRPTLFALQNWSHCSRVNVKAQRGSFLNIDQDRPLQLVLDFHLLVAN